MNSIWGQPAVSTPLQLSCKVTIMTECLKCFQMQRVNARCHFTLQPSKTEALYLLPSRCSLPDQPTPSMVRSVRCVCMCVWIGAIPSPAPQTNTPPATGHAVVMTLLRDQLCLKTLPRLHGEM